MEAMKEGAISCDGVEDIAISDFEKDGVATSRFRSADTARTCVAAIKSRSFFFAGADWRPPSSNAATNVRDRRRLSFPYRNTIPTTGYHERLAHLGTA